MKSRPKQFCRIIQICMERYSKNTTAEVGASLTSHKRVIEIEKLIDKNLPEEEFLKELNNLEHKKLNNK